MTMPRTYIAKRLLEHGALSHREFTQITGWRPGQSSTTLRDLLRAKAATVRNVKGVRLFFLNPVGGSHANHG